MPGLLANGHTSLVPGVTVISPHDEPWCYILQPKDGRPRPIGAWPRQLILHKTIADDPEHVIAGAGPAGGAERTASYWHESDGRDADHPLRNSSAQLVTGDDGVVACLCDIATIEAYHATVSNAWSVGYETREQPGGGVYQAALDATAKTAVAICRALGIQLQVPRLSSYTGHPIPRMLNGGPDMVGVFGHRDNTESRGRWDPGDILFEMLVAAGAEQFDFAAGEDLAVWKSRQLDLNQRGHGLTVDGVAGPATVAALKAEGYVDGIWALGKAT